jgi:hypothetical protein
VTSLADPRPRHRVRLFVRLSGACALLAACAPAEDPPVESLGGEPASDSIALEAPLPGDVSFEREITFLSFDQDSTLVIPWIFRARAVGDGVYREQRVMVARGGTWEQLSHESMSSPPTRTPWRIVPGAATGLVVGPDDRVESLLLRTAPRELELTFGELLTEWPIPGEESVGLLEARAVFPAGTVDGIVLDISRRWEMGADGSGMPGDWIFLHSGPQLQVFLEESGPLGASRSPAQYDGWTRLAFRDLRWDELELEWSEVLPFEEARRDVPVRLRFSAPGGDLSGELEVVSSWLEAGPGEGPILPLEGLFQVRGEIELQGEPFAVVGAVRHVQR